MYAEILKMSLFVEELLDTYKQGKMKSSFSKEDIKKLIFTSLKNTVRFNGMTSPVYNVMLHSYYVCLLSADLYQIYTDKTKYDVYTKQTVGTMGLFHDMGEVIVGDVVYPIKHSDFINYDKLEKIEQAFVSYAGNHIFDIPDFDKKYEFAKPYIKQADDMLGVIELIGVSKDSGDFSSRKILQNIFREDRVAQLNDEELFMETINEHLNWNKEKTND